MRSVVVAVAMLVATLWWGPPVVLTRESLAPLAEAAREARDRLGDDTEVLDLDRISDDDLVRQLRRRAPAVVIAVGLRALEAALAAGGDAPIVFTMVSSPADHLARPLPPRVVGARLNPDPALTLGVLRDVAPRARRVLVLYHPARSRHLIAETRAAARAAALELVEVATPDRASVARALMAPPPRFDAILFLLDATVLYPEAVEELLRLGAARRVPVVGLSEEHCRSGALFVVVSDPIDLGRQAADMARAILAGDRSGGTRWPRRLRLLLNPAIAARLAITPPAAVRGLRVEQCAP